MPLKKVYKRFLGERIHASRVIVVGGCGFLMGPRRPGRGRYVTL